MGSEMCIRDRYRALAVAVERHNVDLNDKKRLKKLAINLDISFQAETMSGMQVFLEGENISRDIALERTAERASVLASYSEVRTALTERQRLFAIAPGLVADGRDMGTVVFPDAVLKLFLTATIETRAKRRYKQLLENGQSGNLARLTEAIQARDRADMDRSVSPLCPAEDALIVDSTALSIDQVCETIISEAKSRSLI